MWRNKAYYFSNSSYIVALYLILISFWLFFFLLFFCKNKNKALEDENPRDPKYLTDGDLKAALLRHGITAGPIVGEGTAVCGGL